MNLQLFAAPRPSEAVSFFNYFYLDGELTNTVFSGAFDKREGIYPNHLYIVYHNSNIYGMIGSDSAVPEYTSIINNGDLILENVNAEYTGSFFANPSNWDSDTEEGYLVEDEIVDAGYFASFTTYHTTKIAGYSSTITLTNCRCTKPEETELSGSYSATVTADNGYYLSSVTTTLGTATIATNKKTAEITISDVTENFTINAQGTAIEKLDIILHPNANGVTDYTKEILPRVKTASTLDINRLFRTEYTITKTIINGSASGDTTIWSGETAQVTITPDINYALPSTITVTNANNTYNNTSGVISLSNATGNVSISATCESSGYNVTVSYTNSTITSIICAEDQNGTGKTLIARPETASYSFTVPQNKPYIMVINAGMGNNAVNSISNATLIEAWTGDWSDSDDADFVDAYGAILEIIGDNATISLQKTEFQ